MKSPPSSTCTSTCAGVAGLAVFLLLAVAIVSTEVRGTDGQKPPLAEGLGRQAADAGGPLLWRMLGVARDVAVIDLDVPLPRR